MSYNCEIKKQSNYLRAYVEGTRILGREVEDMQEALSSIVAKCQREQCFKVMLVLDLKGKHSVMTAFTLTETAESFGLMTNFQVALVSSDKEFQSILLYVADLATEKGYKIKVCEKEEDADAWLKQEEEPA